MLISTGSGEMPMPLRRRHADRDHDQRRRGVADQLAEHRGQQEQARQQRIGAASPTAATRHSAISRAAPVCSIAVESGIIAADQDHVVQSIAR